MLGKNTTNATPRTVLETGVAHIPEDRHRHGLVLSYPIADNMVLSTYYQAPFARGIIIDEAAIQENAQRLIKEFDVRTPSTLTPAASLSGGNQQKVVVAREFSRPIKLLIAAQPTRGLDVGSIEFIHRGIIRQRDEGIAVLLVSAELDEVLALSDRIAVMFKGTDHCDPAGRRGDQGGAGAADGRHRRRARRGHGDCLKGEFEGSPLKNPLSQRLFEKGSLRGPPLKNLFLRDYLKRGV